MAHAKPPPSSSTLLIKGCRGRTRYATAQTRPAAAKTSQLRWRRVPTSSPSAGGDADLRGVHETPCQDAPHSLIMHAADHAVARGWPCDGQRRAMHAKARVTRRTDRFRALELSVRGGNCRQQG